MRKWKYEDIHIIWVESKYNPTKFICRLYFTPQCEPFNIYTLLGSWLLGQFEVIWNGEKKTISEKDRKERYGIKLCKLVLNWREWIYNCVDYCVYIQRQINQLTS